MNCVVLDKLHGQQTRIWRPEHVTEKYFLIPKTGFWTRKRVDSEKTIPPVPPYRSREKKIQSYETEVMASFIL